MPNVGHISVFIFTLWGLYTKELFVEDSIVVLHKSTSELLILCHIINKPKLACSISNHSWPIHWHQMWFALERIHVHLLLCALLFPLFCSKIRLLMRCLTKSNLVSVFGTVFLHQASLIQLFWHYPPMSSMQYNVVEIISAFFVDFFFLSETVSYSLPYQPSIIMFSNYCWPLKVGTS